MQRNGEDGLERLGRRLGAERRSQELSQRSMAQRVGVSASLISQIETGKVQPSVATLMAIASELGLSIDQLLGSGGNDGPSDALPTSSGPETETSRSLSVPARRGRPPVVPDRRLRERIELSSGVSWERLTADPDPDVDFMLVTYPAGSASSDGDQLLTHAGKEYWYIVSGTLRVQVVFDTYTADPDDSFSFECTLPHQFRNEGTEPVVAVVMIVHPGS